MLVDIECRMIKACRNCDCRLCYKAVDEAKERIRGAFSNSELELPKKRITINLAPADIPKDSTSFDLAIATAILVASGQCPALIDSILVGGLALEGSLRSVRGVIGKLLVGRKLGINSFYIPGGNLAQAM